MCLCTGVHFLTKKTSKFGCHNLGGGLLAESGKVSVGVGKVSVGFGKVSVDQIGSNKAVAYYSGTGRTFTECANLGTCDKCNIVQSAG